MRRLEGRFVGPMVLDRDTSFHGMISGDVLVTEGVMCDLHGRIAGDLEIRPGATVTVFGMVTGSSENRGRLTVHGVVRGFMRDADDGITTLVDDREWRSDRHRGGDPDWERDHDRERDRDRDRDRDRERDRDRDRSRRRYRDARA